jgi:formylglycine-generating enzyme required for sulfatase activity
MQGQAGSLGSLSRQAVRAAHPTALRSLRAQVFRRNLKQIDKIKAQVPLPTPFRKYRSFSRMSAHIQQTLDVLPFRVFLSSPGDVRDEREEARKVLRRLENEPQFKNRIHIEEIAWDNPDAPTILDAHLTPQEAINRKLPLPSACDVVVVVFWSRMGTPLPKDMRKPDGSAYRSGTEWEYIDAIKAAKAQGKPQVWLFRRTERTLFDDADPEFEKKLQQKQAVKRFFDELQDASGALNSSYNPYEKTHEFARLLESALREALSKRLQALAPPADSPKAARQPATAAIKPDWTGGNPYRGLKAFADQEADIRVFFGRGREADELLEKLRKGARVLAIIGASGVGKSSLAAAGLLPRLLPGVIPGVTAWLKIRFTPAEKSRDPLANLYQALYPHLDSSAGNSLERLAQAPAYIETLASQALRKQPASAKLLLYIDQFEELFTTRVDADKRQPFVAVMAVLAQSERVCLLWTLRADYYQDCTQFPQLAELLRAASYPLAMPGGRALLDIIESPARIAGLTVDDGLTTALLDKYGKDSSKDLALLEFTLEQLYEAKKADATCLRLEDYQALGEMAGAIDRQGEEAIGDGADEGALWAVFEALAEVSVQGGAVRRRAWKSDFAPGEQALIEKLIHARLLASDLDKNGQAWVEVAHETVLRAWQRYARWLDEHKKFLLWRKRFDEDQSQNLHLGGARLAEALRWWRDKKYRRLLDSKAQAFIRRSRRRAWLLRCGYGAGLLAPLLVSVGISVLAEEARLSLSAGARYFLPYWGLMPWPEPTMVLIKPGQFEMGAENCGADDASEDECPRHRVTLPQAFYLGVWEVTFEEYDAYVASITRGRTQAAADCAEVKVEHPSDQGWGRGRQPVINVDWNQARCYAAWLSQQTGQTYRLPSEAEWEYAARAGTQTQFYWSEDSEKAGDYAWFDGNSGNRTHAVGERLPNAWNLHDMAGNVWEWTQDCWHENYQNAPVDGAAWQDESAEDCGGRGVRGGSWGIIPQILRSADRYWYWPGVAGDSLGFRLARVV